MQITPIRSKTASEIETICIVRFLRCSFFSQFFMLSYQVLISGRADADHFNGTADLFFQICDIIFAGLRQLDVYKRQVEAEYAKLAENYKMEVEKVKGFIPDEEFRKDMAVNKAVDLIKDSAKVTVK